MSDDADEGTFTFVIQGSGTTGAVSCASVSGATLFSQNFEISPATPTLTFTSTNTSISSGTGSFPADNMFSEGSQGLQVNNGTAVVEFATFDSSSYSNLGLSLKLASFAGTSGNGADATDYVKVFVSTDNGTSYSEEVTINGATAANSKWSFASGTGVASVVYDGNNTTTTFAPAGSGDRTTDGYSTIQVSSLPQSSTLKIKIEIRNNSINEYWVIDDVKITGDSESVATWSGSWLGATLAENVKVIFDSDFNMSSETSVDACECEINSGATVTISADKYLKIQNNIINNGTIIVEDGGNIIQVSDVSSISGTGNFLVRRTTANLASKYVFTYWSSPLTSSTLGEIAPDEGACYSFDAGNQSWSGASYSTGMMPGYGYAVQGRSSASYPGSFTAEFTGSSFNNGDISVPLSLGESTYEGASNNWNLIGNPYPSAIDASLFMAANPEISGTIYFWTHNTDASTTKNFSQDDYVSWNGTGGTAGCTGCIAPTGSIASGQGFFASALNSSATVVFKNSMRLGQSNNNFYKNTSTTEDKIWLNLYSDSSFNQILVGFLEKATDGIDRLYDGQILDGGTNANFYSKIEDKNFVIQGKSSLKELEEIPLGFTSNITGYFSIGIDHLKGIENHKIILKDNLLNINHNLKELDYTFKVEDKGVFNDRFVLIIKKEDKALSIEDANLNTQLNINIYDNTIEVNTLNGKLIKKVSVFNILGKEIAKNKSISISIKLISNTFKNNSLLFIQTTLQNGEVIFNKIIKN